MSGTVTDTIYVKEGTGVHCYKVCVIPDWQIEQIADAVVKKLAGDEEKMTFMDIIREMAGEVEDAESEV